MQLFVKPIQGKTIIVRVEAQDSILSIKEKLRDSQGIPEIYQRLVFECKHLEDDKTVSSYWIKTDSTIYLHLGLRGGMQIEEETLTEAPAAIDVEGTDSTASLNENFEDKVNTRCFYPEFIFARNFLQNNLAISDSNIKMNTFIYSLDLKR